LPSRASTPERDAEGGVRPAWSASSTATRSTSRSAGRREKDRGELGRCTSSPLTGRAGTIAQTTQRTDAQRELLAATGVQPPARITALQPA
jgi:hypothetical protein